MCADDTIDDVAPRSVANTRPIRVSARAHRLISVRAWKSGMSMGAYVESLLPNDD